MGLRFSSDKVCKVSPGGERNLNYEILLRLQFLDLKMYNLIELKEATSNFSPENRLGRTVPGFKGFIHGQAVFVQRIDPQGWIIDRISMGKLEHVEKLSHPNIVKMIGYSLEDDKWILVYEFVPTNLKDYLRGKWHGDKFPRYSWSVFLKIALGVAKGLEFLHHEAHVIYQQFKISDVLLDSECNAKLNDYGLANELQRDGNWVDKYLHTRFSSNHILQDLVFASRGPCPKSNVYGFGMMLLEMLSGKEATRIKKPNFGDGDLKKCARSFLEEHETRHVLNAFSDQHYGRNVIRVVIVALCCVYSGSDYRPDITRVVQFLEHGSDYRPDITRVVQFLERLHSD